MSCSRTQGSDAGEARTAASWFRVKHSTTEPALIRHLIFDHQHFFIILAGRIHINILIADWVLVCCQLPALMKFLRMLNSLACFLSSADF